MYSRKLCAPSADVEPIAFQSMLSKLPLSWERNRSRELVGDCCSFRRVSRSDALISAESLPNGASPARAVALTPCRLRRSGSRIVVVQHRDGDDRRDEHAKREDQDDNRSPESNSQWFAA